MNVREKIKAIEKEEEEELKSFRPHCLFTTANMKEKKELFRGTYCHLTSNNIGEVLCRDINS